MEEAEEILSKVQKENPSNAIIFLHQAELQIHKNEFHLAVSLIRKAQKSLQVKEVVLYSPSVDYRELDLSNLSPEEILQKKLRRKQLTERRRLLSKFAERQMSANVFALLGENGIPPRNSFLHESYPVS
jgi:predicted Zn-dependent protease